jgi:DNA-3-methyladenine glycosylase
MRPTSQRTAQPGADPVDPSDILKLPSPQAAPLLIGCTLTCNQISARIVETEAYHTEADLACHASKRRTPRTATLYAKSGTLYVYLCYGLHQMLNLVCDAEGTPSAVLIRAIAITAGEDVARERRRNLRTSLTRLANGPGMVAQTLALNRNHSGLELGQAICPLKLHPATTRPRLANGPRVGVAYAGAEWAAKPWRWWEDGFPVAGRP